MDYWCRLGSLGNLSIASGSSDPGGTVDQSIGTFFVFLPTVILFIFTPYICLLPLFLCHILILLFPCASVGENNSA